MNPLSVLISYLTTVALNKLRHFLIPYPFRVMSEHRPPGIPSFARLIDLEMLAISSNGKERTERELPIFAKAGLAL